MIWVAYAFLIICSIFAVGAALWMLVEGSWLWRLCGILMLTAMLACFLYLLNSRPDPGPCFKWQTQLMPNAATKTMMPSRVCVLRGEWVEEE